jgi:hypothetical protein
MSTFSNLRPSKIHTNSDFWFGLKINHLATLGNCKMLGKHFAGDHLEVHFPI